MPSTSRLASLGLNIVLVVLLGKAHVAQELGIHLESANGRMRDVGWDGGKKMIMGVAEVNKDLTKTNEKDEE